MPPDVEINIIQAEIKGKNKKDDFIWVRLASGCSADLFFELVPLLKLKTMVSCNKTTKLITYDGKIIQYKEQSDLVFMLLIKSQILDQPCDLDELLTYFLFPVPYIFATVDVFFAKTNKAKMLHHLLETYTDTVSYPNDSFYIEDSNALVHVLKDLASTFGEIYLMVLDQMVHKKYFVFSTDSYHPNSIKSQERLRRGTSQMHILSGPATRKPKDMTEFLCNDENKMQLFQLILQVF